MDRRDARTGVFRLRRQLSRRCEVRDEKKITPHIPVIDKSKREDGSLSRADFTFDKDRNVYVCPQGKYLHTTGRIHDGGDCPLSRKNP